MKTKKRIIIFSYNLDFGGIEKSLVTLLKNFDYNRYDIKLVLEEKKGVFLSEIPKDVVVSEYKTSNSKNILIRKVINFSKRLVFCFKNYNKYDASICYATYSMPGAKLSLKSSKNSIMFIHSNYKYIYKNNVCDVKKFFYDRNINKFRHIIFVSNEARRDLIDIIPEIKKNSQVINNLVDYDDIIKKSNLECDYKIDKNKKNILFVGRLEEDSKRITRIINVARKIDDSNYEFLILGDGPDKDMYENLIKKYNLDNVKLLGSKSNPYSYMKQADIIILTSEYEGFPVVYNEAIVLGKPIISTVDVSDDSISINNRFGIISKKNSEGIIEALKKIENISLEKVDYKKINNIRMNSILKLLEGDLHD